MEASRGKSKKNVKFNYPFHYSPPVFTQFPFSLGYPGARFEVHHYVGTVAKSSRISCATTHKQQRISMPRHTGFGREP
jgi:hypothetical protein